MGKPQGVWHSQGSRPREGVAAKTGQLPRKSEDPASRGGHSFVKTQVILGKKPNADKRTSSVICDAIFYLKRSSCPKLGHFQVSTMSFLLECRLGFLDPDSHDFKLLA